MNLPKLDLLRSATWFTAITVTALGVYLVGRLFLSTSGSGGLQVIASTLQGSDFWIALAIGVAAQAVDGALGMGYGVTASSFLLGTGASPAVASASTHIAKLFTTGVSGIAHAKYGNVDRKLFVRLLLPGMGGGMLGVLLVTSIDGARLKPFVSAYLLVIGLHILAKAYRRLHPRQGEPRHAAKLGLFGGFVDAVGGGGWGPVVTTTLLGSGQEPRRTIGSVNAAEFFIAVASGFSLAILGGVTVWTTIAGLIFGGMFAAPLAALLTRHAPTKLLLVIVGLLISGLSIYNLSQVIF